MDMSNSSNYEEIVKGMRDKAAEFDAALCKVKKTNDELMNRAEKTLQNITELMGTCGNVSVAQKCTVCYTRELQTALVPCGHTFCSSCAARAETRGRCHTCRGRVDSTMRVYI